MSTQRSSETPQKKQGKRSIRKFNEQRILRAAEQVFAQTGFKGTTTREIARVAGVPKANVHYYFSTKAELYRHVIEDVGQYWINAALPFDSSDDPATALCGYIRIKMQQARERPYGSKIWAMEVIRGAPVIDGYLHTVLYDWFKGRTKKIKTWIKDGKMDNVDPQTLFFMIWATTQHYADFEHQICTLNKDKPLSDRHYARATNQVCEIILKGVGLTPPS